MSPRNGRRSTEEIRASLRDARHRLDENLTALEGRVEEASSPQKLLTRHPALMAAAGIAIGFVVIRNPAMVGRTLTRLAQVGTPLLVRELMQRGGGIIAQLTSAAKKD